MINARVEESSDLWIRFSGETEAIDGHSEATLRIAVANQYAATISAEVVLPGAMNFQDALRLSFGTMSYGWSLARWADDLKSYEDDGAPISFSDVAEDFIIAFPHRPSSDGNFPATLEYRHSEFAENPLPGEARFTSHSLVGHRSDIPILRAAIREFIQVTQIDLRHPMEGDA